MIILGGVVDVDIVGVGVRKRGKLSVKKSSSSSPRASKKPWIAYSVPLTKVNICQRNMNQNISSLSNDK